MTNSEQHAKLGEPARQRPLVLGQHTCISIAKESGVWNKIPLLDKNDGLLPPAMIVVGDRRRVISAAKRLKDPVLLHDAVEKLVGPHGSGRVNVAIGVYEHNGKPLPVTILETQIGCPAQDIHVWEALAHTRDDAYLLDGTEIPAQGITAIRAGTCGGIIISNDAGVQTEQPFIQIGDIIIATSSLADGATVRQRLGCGNSLDKRDMRRFKDLWYQHGHGFTPDGQWPLISSSSEVVDALSYAGTMLKLRCHNGANVTKESLYWESDEAQLKSLRRMYGVLSTEMEHFGLAFMAHEYIRTGILVRQGLASCVVGTVPGGSFAAPGTPEERTARESEQTLLDATLLALWTLTYGVEGPNMPFNHLL